MAKESDVQDSTTRPHLHVIADLRFHIVKEQHMYVLFYLRFFHIV